MLDFPQEYENNLKRTTDTLEDLKFVLRTIAEIQSQSDIIEAKTNDIRDRYNLLESYHQKVSPASTDGIVHGRTIHSDV